MSVMDTVAAETAIYVSPGQLVILTVPDPDEFAAALTPLCRAVKLPDGRVAVLNRA